MAQEGITLINHARCRVECVVCVVLNKKSELALKPVKNGSLLTELNPTDS